MMSEASVSRQNTCAKEIYFANKNVALVGKPLGLDGELFGLVRGEVSMARRRGD